MSPSACRRYNVHQACPFIIAKARPHLVSLRIALFIASSIVAKLADSVQNAYGESRFHGGNTGSNPVGDAKSFIELRALSQAALVPRLRVGDQRAPLLLTLKIEAGITDEVPKFTRSFRSSGHTLPTFPSPIQRLSLLCTLIPGGIPSFVRGSKVELRPKSHNLNLRL